jgi:type IV pilus assembly protein PilY1
MNYQNSPITSTGRTVPRVLLVMSKDHKLFQQAYNNFSDMDEDGLPDTGYNPSVLYYGYFDSKSCYRYSRAEPAAEDLARKTEHFELAGPTREDQPQSALDSARPHPVARAGIKAARAVHYSTGEKIGICNGPHSTFGGLYSGNWLNFVTATRMDVFRKILYGGHRSIDTDARTQLQSSLVPRDAHTWGTDVLADDRWAEESNLSKYYDISKYTPFPKPSPGTAHFFVRTRNKSSSQGEGHFPLIQYILSIGSGDDLWQSKVQGSTHRKTGGRYYDWALNEAPNPSTLATLKYKARRMIRELVVHVDVCDQRNFAIGDACRAYPNGNLKPSGLLQQNGEHGQMLFGLLTGTYDLRGTGYDAKDGPGEYTRRKGGVVRAHVNNLADSLDLGTGIFRKGGLIKTIDGLVIAGSPTFGGTYTTATSWGNPVGELLYEGVRYFQRLTEPSLTRSSVQPTPDFVPKRRERDSFPDIHLDLYADWNVVPAIPASECAKPVIILFGEAETDFDGDHGVNRPGGLNSKPLPSLSKAGVALPVTFDMPAYLARITDNEGFSRNGKTYYWSPAPTFHDPNDIYNKGKMQKSPIWGDCSPKPIKSLAQVNGICPNRPSFEGTYSSSAVAYFAHTHDFSPPGALEEQGIDVYAVTLTPTFPALDFPLYGADGKPARRMEILPMAMSSSDVYTTWNRLMEVMNYYILDWRTDSRGTPYSVTVRVNYEAQSMGYSVEDLGSNWDADIIVEHVFELISDRQTSKTGGAVYDMSRTRPVNAKPSDKTYYQADWISGALKAKGGTYYAFRDPQDGSPFVIEPSEVAGLINGQWKVVVHIDKNMMTGYTVSGSTHDGIYMDLAHRQTSAIPMPKLGTPPACNWPAGYGSSAANGFNCFTAVHATAKPLGKPDDISEKVWRTFEFDHDPGKAGNYLPNPLYLAAKYGGYTDYNRNGVPDKGEWEGDDGNPKTYFQPVNVSELPARLDAVFREISRSVSTSTASSASIDTIMGGGVSVQTVYYPVYTNPDRPAEQLRWVGTVYGLFLDKWGNLREDNDHDGVLDMVNGQGAKGDFVVTFNSLSHKPDVPPPCYEFGDYISRCYDPLGNNRLTLMPDGRRHPSTVHRIEPLFDAGSWLAHLDPAKLATGPRPRGSAATAGDGRRRILYEAPATASRPKPELAEFWYGNQAELEKLMLHSNYQESLPGKMSRSQATKSLIDWIYGIEVKDWRSRTVGDPWKANGGQIVWRLGDVINSKPILVGSPSSGFDLLYGDKSYTQFKNDKAARRHMAYFGGNDGMLHAVNIGFPGHLANGRISFATSSGGSKAHDRGAEVWALIPASVLPHLRWLPDPQYSHSYYVDQKPLVVDIQINGKWRTVLIGGLRLGGRPIETPDGAAAGAEHYFSEVFALDVTDPESDPVLLWRYSTRELGLTVGLPSVVSAAGSWYVVLPTGPVTDNPVTAATSRTGKAFVQFASDSPYNGYSKQKARLIVLDAATGVPHPANSNPNYLTVIEPDSFFNNPFLPAAQIRKAPWTNHALYYGLTVSRNHADCTDTGAVYRLKTVDGDGLPLAVSAWELKRLINTARPVTGAVNSAYDSAKNLWVVFGTGRIWGTDDVMPCSSSNTPACEQNHVQYLFGIKEELNAQGFMTFGDRTPESARILDVSGGVVHTSGHVTGIAPTPALPGSAQGATTYSLVKAQLKSPALIGYKKALRAGDLLYPNQRHSYEMVLTQPKFVVLGNGSSLTAFTSFEPRTGGCGDSGDGYLYLLDSFTGLPEPSTRGLFTTDKTDSGGIGDKVKGAVAVGKGKPTEAFVVASASGTSISASAEDASTVSIHIPLSSLPASRQISWKEVLDTGFRLTPSQMVMGL